MKKLRSLFVWVPVLLVAGVFATNSQAATLTTTNIGNPAIPGTVTSAGGGYDITAAGTNIFGIADQFTFGYEQIAGNFDLKVRAQSLSATDPWAKSGLMARESLNANSRFAASLAGPNITGAAFTSRLTNGASAASSGTYPVNYPQTWLRLQRSGDTLTGYASFDGQNWTVLGRVTLSALPSAIYVGLAGCSANAAQTATAQFRDYNPVVGGTVVPFIATREPLGPSSRRTGLVISEIMYHPKDRPDGKQPEFIEIYNSMSIFEDISGYKLTGDVEYTFPNGTLMQPGTFLVLAKIKSDVQSIYGISGVIEYGMTNGFNTNIIGNTTNITANITNGLSNGGGTLKLLGRAGQVLLDISFSTQYPWPIEANGAGHSLVLALPSYGEGDRRAWGASDLIGGSPGSYDPLSTDPARFVVINEFLAHTDPPQEDMIELYNHGTTAVDISGFWLSDTVSTNKYQVPNGTVLAPRGFISFTASTNVGPLNLGFALSAAGEQIILVNSNQNRVLQAVGYEGQENSVSMGRYPDGAPSFQRLSAVTAGTTNAPPRTSPVVINEIMYNPISGNSDDEFVELYNRSAAPVNLGNWQFNNGISFTFPPNTILQPGAYLVVAKDATHLKNNYNNLSPANLIGNYSGTLANGGEHLALAAPDYEVTTNGLGQVTTNVSFRYVVNEVSYGTSGRWGNWADGGGSSLELIDPRSDNSLAANWADSDETAKSTWTGFEATGTIDNVFSAQGANDNLQVFLLGVGECLIDDIELRGNAPVVNLLVNSTFESGLAGWTRQGSHDRSFIENTGFSGSKSLHIVAQSRGDNGGNRIRGALTTPLTSSTATLRAKARWLRGFPEVLLRIHGGGLEAFGRLPVPANLGSPGAANSRSVTNAGPAVHDVTHSPALPQVGDAVQVTARVHDPDGVSQLVIRYRVDPGTTVLSATMGDNGSGGDAVAGDGLFTGIIPAQNSGTMIAFYIQSVDNTGVTNLFPANATRLDLPNDSPTHECLVRWGEIQMPGSFATYHIWITDGTAARWTSRDRLNNAQLDGTFVYNNTRVVYNMKPQYAGSPWHNGQMTGPLNQGSRQDYVMNFNKEEKMLGVTDFVLNTPGNPGGNTSSDGSAMAEQISYETFKGINIHYNYRRYIHLFLNGFQRSITGDRTGNFIMEDSQQPNGDAIEEWFPGETDGQLYKIEDWFEFADNGLGFSNDDADLIRRTTAYNGVSSLKIAPYRFMWRKRSVGAGDSANDYTNFLAMVDIVSPASSPSISPLTDGIVKQFGQVADFEQWMRIFAVQHTVGNWDAYGYDRGKNAFTYRPERGKFNQWTWDIDFTMGVGGNGPTTPLFNCNDPRVVAMYGTPEILRAYWRAFQDIVNGPLNTAYMDPLINGRLAAFRANNINVSEGVATGTIRPFITDRRNFIIAQLATVAANFGVPTTNFTTSSNIVTISGTAPIDVKFIEINGVNYPITWTSTTAWTLRLPMSVNGSNGFVLQAFDRLNRPISNTTRTLGINFTGTIEAPENSIVFNEIMYNPLVAGAEYVELFNRSTNYTFEIGGWQISGLDYTFPEGASIGPRGFIVLTKDRVAFANAYGGSVPAYGQFSGELQADGETLTLIKPGATPAQDLIVDRVRYEGALPWPAAANGTGSAFQLLDASQENARVGNWFSRYVPPVYSGEVFIPAQVIDGWRFVSVTGVAGPGIGGNQMRLLVFLDETNGASAVIDDLAIVPGTTPAVGTNYVRNGDFETPPLLDNPALTNSWVVNTNYTNTVITSGLVHSGSGALKLVCTTFGNSFGKVISQNLSPAPLTNAVHTMSFWFWATNSATNLSVRIQNSSALNLKTNMNIVYIPSNYIPPTVISRATNTLSPGAANQQTVTLPAFPPLWINELQADNLAGIVDNAGQHDPWIEIYNTSTNLVSLEGLYLSASYTNLTSWAFPAGSSIGPKQFLIVFCDGESAQTGGTEYHTGFRLPSGSGSIALSRIYNNAPQVLDYVNYGRLPADRSYGSYPDGQPFDRRELFYVTAAGPNDGRSAPLTVFINEWMAGNTSYLADPADNDYDDWFELYNPGTNEVDIAGYYLTDSSTNGLGVVTNKFKYLIPENSAHIIPPQGFLLVWADNETSQNTSGGIPRGDLHVNFQLSTGGEALGLFAADGTQIDFVLFGQQSNNISEGRYPNGQATIYAMTNATPRFPNYIAGVGNYAPFLIPIGDRAVFVNQALTFTATSFDLDPGQIHSFTLDAGVPPTASIDLNTGAFSWTPTTAGTYIIPVRVTDNGVPSLDDYENVVVRVSNLPGLAGPTLSGNDLTLSWLGAAGRTYQVQYKNVLSDSVNWENYGQPLTLESEAVLSVSDDIRNSQQRFFRVIVLP